MTKKLIGKLIKNTQFWLGCKCVQSEYLFRVYRLRKSVKSRVANQQTDLCIEGFQRSGNSFLYMCLSLANPDLSIAHHIHGTAHIQHALNLKKPVAVVVREPAECIASLLTWDDRLSVSLALNAYIDYYTKLHAKCDNILIIEFGNLVKDFNSVVDKVWDYSRIQLDKRSLSQSEISQKMIERQARYKNKFGTPFPSSQKEKVKQNHINSVLEHEKFSLATKLHLELLKRTSHKVQKI